MLKRYIPCFVFLFSFGLIPYEIRAQSKGNPLFGSDQDKRVILFSESFQINSPSPNNPAILNFKSGSWFLKDATVVLNPSYHKSGSKVIQIQRHGKLSMGFDIAVKKVVWIYIGTAMNGSGVSTTWGLYASYNGGKSYHLVSDKILVKDKQFTYRVFLLPHHKGKMRFEIRRLGGDNSVIFDSIEVKTADRVDI